MNKVIVISGDIVSSTSLVSQDKRLLEMKLKQLIVSLDTNFNAYARLVKGDYLECVVPNPQDALQVALIIKCFIKAIDISNDDAYKNNHRVKFFKTYGIRLALGYGTLDRFDREQGIIDGDAIYRSGRIINANTTHDKQRIVIKSTLFFSSKDKALNLQMDAILSLLDTILSKTTARQSEVVYHKLMGNTEDDVSRILDIGQSTVNQHSTSAGWNSIETTISYFSTLFTQLKSE